MTHASAVSQTGGAESRDVRTADVVIGIPTYNHADEIAHALRAAQAGCAALAGDAVCTVVHADGGSSDGTVERGLEETNSSVLHIAYPLDAVDRMGGPYRGVPAKGNAVRAIFTAAREVGAKACVVVDVDVAQFAPGWLDALIRPVLAHDHDFVAPYYGRHPLGGAINNGVAFPFVRALFGRRVRYPMGGDFACSMRLVDRLIAENMWDREAVKSMVDLWLAMRAVAEGLRVGQAVVGVKRQSWKVAAADGADALAQVLSALFQGADRWQSVWQKVRGSEPVTLYGGASVADDTPVVIDVRRGIETFRLAQKNLGEVWRLVLPPGTMLELQKLAALPEAAFQLPDSLWARIVYDFSLAYRQRVLNRDHVLSAFAPLFSAWVSSFVTELPDATLEASEDRLERMCLRFEAEKPYLISRWRWPDRFSP